MSSTPFTRYLTVGIEAATHFTVRVQNAPPAAITQEALTRSSDLRYSPIMPAFLTPKEGPPAIPAAIDSVSFFFARAPYKALGTLKPELNAEELGNTYFTEGLASMLILNTGIDRTRTLSARIGSCPFEFWPLAACNLNIEGIVTELSTTPTEQLCGLTLPQTDEAELAVYVEQISASIASLWAAYGVYYPEERNTLHQLAEITQKLIQRHTAVKAIPLKNQEGLAQQKKANAIVSALVELSAALSYAVTQGASGTLPILWNRSPFPHHSLLGIGGSVRALTKFTRYLETAFMVRSASDVIRGQYSVVKHEVPSSIPKYQSGPEYRLAEESAEAKEHFDAGGEFRQDDHVPLIAHFSLRHGFMESKFSVTAASEALTAEVMPQWTLMTLSHEVMHSRVRTIFQALFGATWDESENALIRQEHFHEFSKWIDSRGRADPIPVEIGLRNTILNFCYAIERSWDVVLDSEDYSGRRVTIDKLSECYCRHKHLV